MTRTVAIDLDGALGDTRPLWEAFLEDASRRFARSPRSTPRRSPPIAGQAAAELDRWAGERGRRLARGARRASPRITPRSTSARALRRRARAAPLAGAGCPDRRLHRRARGARRGRARPARRRPDESRSSRPAPGALARLIERRWETASRWRTRRRRSPGSRLAKIDRRGGREEDARRPPARRDPRAPRPTVRGGARPERAPRLRGRRCSGSLTS